MEWLTAHSCQLIAPSASESGGGVGVRAVLKSLGGKALLGRQTQTFGRQLPFIFPLHSLSLIYQVFVSFAVLIILYLIPLSIRNLWITGLQAFIISSYLFFLDWKYSTLIFFSGVFLLTYSQTANISLLRDKDLKEFGRSEFSSPFWKDRHCHEGAACLSSWCGRNEHG